MTTDDMTEDLDTELRSDAALWREQVDGLRPDFAPAPAQQRRRMTPVLAGLAAAAVVLGATVLVLVLRHNAGSTPRTQAGIAPGPAPTAVSKHVPHSAQCAPPPGGGSSSQTGFSRLLAPNATGSPTIGGAVRAARFGPRTMTSWHLAARNDHAALVLSGPRYLHVRRLRDRTWYVDGGGKCGSGRAVLP
jgi:hypothetical protein